MNTSPELNELAAALCLAQAEIAGAHKNAANPFFKSKYSDLASCWSAVREPLTKHALSVVQSPSADGAKVSVETMLLHASGQWVAGTMTATAKDDSPQAIIPPDGFEHWLDELATTANEGQVALKQAWTASPKPFRAHLTQNQPQRWANLKLSAAAIQGES